MILINNIWWNEESNEDLIELARLFNEEFGRALENKLNYYSNLESESLW